MTRLSVNLNKVALLRNQRDVGYPNVIDTAHLVLDAGAGGITVHPRPDERHIRRTDVPALAAAIASRPDRALEFNVEGFPTPGFLDLVIATVCHQVTLVPDAPGQATSDHGWNDRLDDPALRDAITRLKAAGRRIVLFMDADAAAVARVKALGADGIELYTGPYAFSYGTPEGARILAAHQATAKAAQAAGLIVNAGHDLNLDNLAEYLAAVPACAEVSIGHAITADALLLGWEGAVRQYKAICDRAA